MFSVQYMNVARMWHTFHRLAMLPPKKRSSLPFNSLTSSSLTCDPGIHSLHLCVYTRNSAHRACPPASGLHPARVQGRQGSGGDQWSGCHAGVRGCVGGGTRERIERVATSHTQVRDIPSNLNMYNSSEPMSHLNRWGYVQLLCWSNPYLVAAPSPLACNFNDLHRKCAENVDADLHYRHSYI